MTKTVRGIVLRDSLYKDSSRILTILTDSEGKITASAHGAKRRGSKIAAVTQLLAFSELSLSHSRGRWYLNNGNTIELFRELRSDILRFSSAMYFAELLDYVTDPGINSLDILRLGLNALYKLCSAEPKLIKSAFELRLMCLCGYEPALDSCAICANSAPHSPVFMPSDGILLCESCSPIPTTSHALPLCHGSLEAMRFIIAAADPKVFSFTLKHDALSRLVKVSEEYVALQLEKHFDTLHYLKLLENTH